MSWKQCQPMALHAAAGPSPVGWRDLALLAIFDIFLKVQQPSNVTFVVKFLLFLNHRDLIKREVLLKISYVYIKKQLRKKSKLKMLYFLDPKWTKKKD